MQLCKSDYKKPWILYMHWSHILRKIKTGFGKTITNKDGWYKTSSCGKVRR